MANTRVVFLSFIFIMGLGYMGWHIAKPETIKRLDQSTLDKTPDAIIYQLSVKKFNTKGQLSYHLETDKLEHIPHKNTSHLRPLKITTFQEKQEPWVITANLGISVDGTEEIKLRKNVIITQKNDKGTSTLLTEKLLYYPNKDLATTDEKVTYIQPGITVTSIGMNAFLKQKRVKLLSQAWGRYEANTS
jgi:lipopolysaccharide export system protein LptC